MPISPPGGGGLDCPRAGTRAICHVARIGGCPIGQTDAGILVASKLVGNTEKWENVKTAHKSLKERRGEALSDDELKDLFDKVRGTDPRKSSDLETPVVFNDTSIEEAIAEVKKHPDSASPKFATALPLLNELWHSVHG